MMSTRDPPYAFMQRGIDMGATGVSSRIIVFNVDPVIKEMYVVDNRYGTQTTRLLNCKRVNSVTIGDRDPRHQTQYNFINIDINHLGRRKKEACKKEETKTAFFFNLESLIDNNHTDSQCTA